MRYWLRCKQAHQLLSEQQDRELGKIEKVALRMHLAICHSCQNFSGQMTFLRQAMRNWPEQAEPEETKESSKEQTGSNS